MKLKFIKISSFILILMSIFALAGFNNLQIKAADVEVYTAESGTPSLTNYTLVQDFTSTDYSEGYISLNISTAQLVSKSIIITFGPNPNGGDTRGVLLLENNTYVKIPYFGNTESGEILYNGQFAAEYNIMPTSLAFIFSNYGMFDGWSIKIYKSNIQPDVVEPMLETEQYIYITSVDNPTSIANMQSAVNLQAHDNIDGDITHKILVDNEGGYATNVKNKALSVDRILGDYAIRFKVTDNSNNTAYATITIRVVDTGKPVINTSTSTLTYNTGYYNQEITAATIIAGINATDNHSTNLTKQIISNTYTPNKTNIGSYSVVVQVTDISGNYSRVTVSIVVYDNVKPVFAGGTSFYKSYDVSKSLNDIISFLVITATDTIDGNLTIANGKMTVVTDTYTGNANVPGNYSIKLRATDTRGNFSEHTISVTIGDDVIPFFLINKNRVIIEIGVNMDGRMLIKTLKDVGVIENKSLSFTVVNDTYSGNEEIVGEYRYDLKVLYEDGIEKIMMLDVEVVDTEDLSERVPVVKNIFKSIINFFVKAWNVLKFPFVWTFNSILKPLWQLIFK